MKRLYSILAILFLAGCARATTEPTAVLLPTIPPEWLTRPPTPILATQEAVSELPPGTIAPAASPTTGATAVSPTPTEASLLASLFESSQEEPAVVPLTISAAAGVPVAVIAQAQQIAAAQPQQYVWAEDRETSDLQITIADGAPLGAWVFVAAAPFATVEDGTSLDALQALWTSVAAPETPLIVTADVANLLTTLWGSPGPAVSVVPAEALRESLWAARPSRTIMPFPDLTPDLKLLQVGGVSPLNADFDPSTYALSVPITVQGEKTAVAELSKLWNQPSNFDPQKLTTVAMTGVTALVRATATQMEIDGILTPARDVGPVLRAADFAHISNEVSFAPDCPEPNPIGGTTFCSQDEYFALLTELGTDIVELTGNHLNDWGVENLTRSMEMYEAAGMRTFGGGRNAAEAQAPLLLEHNGNRIAMIGCNYFGPAYAWATESSPGSAVCAPDFAEQIRELKDQGYTVLATQQYTEYYQYPAMPDQAADFRALAEAGADAVSGSQGHHAQAFEFAGDSFIHYGLGNLFFDQMDMMGTRESFVDTYAIYDGRLLNVSLWTGLIENYFLPRLMTPEERAATLGTLFQASGW